MTRFDGSSSGQGSPLGLAALEALFDAVLVVDRHGEVVRALGCTVDRLNVLDDPRFHELWPEVTGALKGDVFDEVAVIPSPPDFTRERLLRIRVAPWGDAESPHAVLLFEEPGESVERILLSRLREYDFVFREMRQGIWRLDPSGKIQVVNPYLANLLESTPERLIGRRADEFLKRAEGRDADHYEADLVTETGLTRRMIVVGTEIEGREGQSLGRSEVITDITAQHALQTRLTQEVLQMTRLASLDPLTEVLNRRGFEQRLSLAVEHARQTPFGVVLLDLDNLKTINDRHGHAAGDAALRMFASRIGGAIRDSDRLARIGGDEFAVLAVGIDAIGLQEMAYRLAELGTFEMDFGGVRASVGAAHSDFALDQMLPAADAAMYRDKQRRRTGDPDPDRSE
ncbi:MAG TPA: sensor domain-containing diguanylate cyclase [Fimbriimonadaceae bacterium]|nr:sensor domain-containing diguanylate cyclase [Fimbriimonadaceae bacterium]